MEGLRMSIDDPLSQGSPRPPAAASATTAYLEDDPEAAGGGGASFGGAQPSFEQEPKGAPPGTSQRRDSSSGRGGEHMWTSANPVAGAEPRSYPAAANQGFVDAASADSSSMPRSRFDNLSRSMGSLPATPGQEDGVSPTSSGVGVSPTYFDQHRPGQSPDYGAALDRLQHVQHRRGGLSRHLRGVNPGNYLEGSLFAAEGDVSPRSLAPSIQGLARAASNANGLAWRSGSRPQDVLTAAEVLAQYEAAGGGGGGGGADVEYGGGGGGGTSPLRSWSAAAASAFGAGEESMTGADGRRSVRWEAGVGGGGGGGAAGPSVHFRSGMSGIGENCLVIMTMVTMGCVLYVLQQVLVPLVLAVFVSAMLLPMLDFVTERPFHLFGRVWLRDTCGLCLKVEQRYDNWLGHLVSSLLTVRLPNVIGLLVVLGVVCVLGFGLGVLVYYSVENFWSKSEHYEQEIFNITSSMPDWVISHVGNSGKEALSKEQLFGTLTDSAAASEVVIDILMESEHVLTTTALTFLYTIFILLGRQDRTVRETKKTLVVIEDQLQVYLSWKFVVSAISGTVIGVTLGQLGIDLAAVFGLLTFFLNFIPTVGLLVAVVLPIPLIYISPVPATNKILAVIIPYGTQVLVTNFVEPLVFGRRLHLHPIFVLFSLVFWNMLWGLTGAVLSIPIMCVLKIVLLNMPNPTATFLASMMEGHFEASKAARLAMSAASAPAAPRFGTGQEASVPAQQQGYADGRTSTSSGVEASSAASAAGAGASTSSTTSSRGQAADSDGGGGGGSGSGICGGRPTKRDTSRSRSRDAAERRSRDRAGGGGSGSESVTDGSGGLASASASRDSSGSSQGHDSVV